MADTKTNLVCAHCDKAHDALNGRYCNILNVYVEYAQQPLCGKKSE